VWEAARLFCHQIDPTFGAIDLRTLDRHPPASVGTLVLGLRCSWGPGSAPMPKLLGLYALPPWVSAARARLM
jgi:hypothetical protein